MRCESLAETRHSTDSVFKVVPTLSSRCRTLLFSSRNWLLNMLLSLGDIQFDGRGMIAWSGDGLHVSFRVNDVEVSAFNTIAIPFREVFCCRRRWNSARTKCCKLHSWTLIWELCSALLQDSSSHWFRKGISMVGW
ncbi:MAG: hypothetical protein M2R45_00762 [Verrucomicrobia subdivision 3 bacterium]|nr:hypothetical protein [Limisphaerales bacterium]MCS1413132.1 hypothetical protein [Limisphaerales bacterium]